MATMGQQFIAAREKKKMDLSRAAALTRIKIQHLERMEADDFSGMPAPTYAKGFIRIYAEVLGLNPEPLIREYIEKHLDRPGPGAASPSSRPRKKKQARPRAPARPADRTSPDGAAVWKQIGPLLARARAALEALTPRLIHGISAVIAVLLLVGIVRCTVRVAGSGEEETAPARLNADAIMKEPPVRYLSLPQSEDPTL
jgi:hypothetical protein